MIAAARKIWIWIKAFWVREEALQAKQDLPVIKPPRRKTKRTIADTLDKLDHHFELLALHDCRALSENDWNTRRALRKIGAYSVPIDFEVQMRRIEHDKRPTVMFIAPFPKDSHEGRDDDIIPASFMYGMKLDKAPVGVAHGDGDIYEVGLSWKLEKKLSWAVYFVSIEDGVATALKRKVCTRVNIPRKKGGYPRQIVQSSWAVGFQTQPGDMAEYVQNATHMMFNLWKMKDEMWTVMVKQGKYRMNFAVETRETKHYFRDRIKVKTPSGRTKPIIHFVEGFIRKNGQKVIPHIRGIRQFMWNNYTVNVKTPRFGGGLLTHEFDIAGSEDLGRDSYTPSQMATMFNEIDDEIQLNASEY